MSSKLHDRLLEVFKRENKELTPQQAAELANLNSNTTRRLVRELAKAGSLRKVEGTRRYALP
jgi:DNA-binding IclR family transcriptional regulator